MNQKNDVPEKAPDEEAYVMTAVRRIVAKGNSAEIKRTTDGRLKVFEVKRSIAAGREPFA